MLKLVQTDWGKFDLAFDDPATSSELDVVATLVYAALFTDAEASPRRVPDRFDRRGWFADPQAGTGLWYVRRQPLHSAARAEALQMVRQALHVHAPALPDVAVDEVVGDGSGSVSSVVLDISGTHNGRRFLIKVPL